MTGTDESQEEISPAKENAALYIDGFNFYHSIDDTGKDYLKWIDLWKLGNLLIPKVTEQLVKVVFCTSYNKKDFGKLTRHQKYIKALTHFGVTCVLGHFTVEPRDCRKCGHKWTEQAEKETDVNLALHLFHDAHLGVFHHAYLLTADSDQAATAKMLKEAFPKKKLTTVAPLGRNFSTSVLLHAHAKMAVTELHLERAVMPRTIFRADGSVVVFRPDEYAPPNGWVHPDKRP